LVGRAGSARGIGGARQFIEIVDIEVADAPVADAAVGGQGLHRRRGVGQRVFAAPVQQVDVDAVELQALPAAVEGGDGAAPAGVVWIDLADDGQVLACHVAGTQRLGHGLPDHLLGAALAVHLGGVDQAVTQCDGLPHRGHFGATPAVVLAHAPGAETECRQCAAAHQRQHPGSRVLIHRRIIAPRHGGHAARRRHLRTGQRAAMHPPSAMNRGLP
jgi:hypothetical protein